MKEKNIVGENVRKIRLKEYLTQEELALKSGLSQGYVNQLESGKRGFTQKSLEMIVTALSVPISELFKGDSQNTPQIREKTTTIQEYRKKAINPKEFQKLLNDLPAHIAEHYVTLLKLEKKLLDSKRLKNN